jgi:hypothetical protein
MSGSAFDDAATVPELHDATSAFKFFSAVRWCFPARCGTDHDCSKWVESDITHR